MAFPAASVLAAETWEPIYATQTHLDPTVIDQFMSPLPVLSVAGGSVETIVADTAQMEIDMKEFRANMLPGTFTPETGTYEGTWVWGYVTPDADTSSARDTYTGPVVVATRGVPSEFKFVNDLGTTNTTNVLAYKYSTDQSLHWANPGGVDKYVPNPYPGDTPPDWLGNPDHYSGAIPAAVHLHGAEDPAAVDGGPDSWFTSAGQHGATFYSKDGNTYSNYCIYTYPNVQEAAPLWFHDHTLGATRLNVYMGLAGAYALIDPNLALPAGLHPYGLRDASSPDDILVPLVIQDRMFDTNGQLLYNNALTDPDPQNYAINPQHPYWTPEFFGDTIAVNGKVWPYLEVKAQRYRFFMINGSNARSYVLSFADTTAHANSVHPEIWQIATDQGYLDEPVGLVSLRIMPGERAEFIIDFGGISPGTNLVLNNFGPDSPLGELPVPGEEVSDPATTGTVMQFRVVSGAATPDTSFNPAAAGATIRTGDQKIVRLVDPFNGTLAKNVKPDLTRELTLVEIANDNPTTVNGVTYEGGPLEVLVNNTKWMGQRPDEANPNQMMGLTPVNGGVPDGIGNYLTELPKEGTTEVWEIVNTTMDAHPIHTHLAQFQLLNRQAFFGMWADPVMGTPSTGFIEAYEAAFPSGSFTPAYGPPLAYGPGTASGGKYGGNPDVTPFLAGPVIPPDPNEAGWKDTVFAPPGMVTRFVVRWAPTDIGVANHTVTVDGKQLPANYKALRYAFIPDDVIPGTTDAYFDYVWHCHIVDHEDNEMMRPDAVIPSPYAPANRGFMIGRDY
jgi:spore coat protein A